MGKRPAQATPDDVLRGRVVLDALGLCALIREVNPSDRGLSAGEQTRRYSLKSRLQSLLVRRYADQISVAVDGGAEAKERNIAGERGATGVRALGTVLLLHTATRTSAGHAAIAELEDDARSWVQRQIDMGEAMPLDEPTSSRHLSTESGGWSRASSKGGQNRAASAKRSNSGKSQDSGGRRQAPQNLEPDLNWDEAASAADLLRAGQKALSEYDYETARSCFLKAHEREEGTSEAATALVELLVDQLGADTEALEFARSCSGRTLGDPLVRSPLALAAARCGESELAIRWVGDLNGVRAADVWVRLSTLAANASELETGAKYLAKAKVLVATHPEFAEVEMALERLRQDQLKPRMIQLKTLVQEGKWEEAETVLLELRKAGPFPPELRAEAAQIETFRRHKKTQDLLGRATQALAVEDTETALGALRQALLDPPDGKRQNIEKRLAEAETLHHEAADRNAAESFLKLLSRDDLTDALVGYATLLSGAREKVRVALQTREDSTPFLRPMAHIDAIGGIKGGSQARAAAAAALALARAEGLVEQDAEAAFDLLTPHTKLLSGVPALGVVAERAEAARKERERKEAHARFEEAKARFANFRGQILHAGGTEPDNRGASARHVVESLSEATLRHLSNEQRKEGEAIRTKAALVWTMDDITTYTRKAILRGDVTAAHEYARSPSVRSHLSLSEKAADAALLSQIVDLAVERFFMVNFIGGAVVGEPEPLSQPNIRCDLPMPDAWNLPLAGRGCVNVCISDDGGTLTWLQSSGTYVFVRRIDIAVSPPLLQTFAILNTPAPMYLRQTVAWGDRIIGIGRFGTVLSLGISATGCRISGWLPTNQAYREQEKQRLDDVEVAPAFGISPDGRNVWRADLGNAGIPSLAAYDSKTLRKTHEVETDGDVPELATVLGSPGVAVVTLNDFEGGLSLRDENGRSIKGGTYDVGAIVESATAFPGGGIFVVAGDRADNERPVHLIAGSEPHTLRGFPELVANKEVVGAATDVANQRIFVLVEAPYQERSLIAFAATTNPSNLTLLYQIPLPSRSRLVVSPNGLPFLLIAEDGLFQVIPLGPRKPSLSGSKKWLPFVCLPDPTPAKAECRDRKGPRPDAVESWVERFSEMGPAEANALIAQVITHNEAEDALDMAWALELFRQPKKALEIEEIAFKKYPLHAEHRWVAACRAADRGDWDVVRPHLMGLDATAFTDPMRRHLAHILGLALMVEGRHDEAHGILQGGLGHHGPCDLTSLLAVAAPLTDSPYDNEGRTAALRALLRQVASADECLAVGNWEGAIRLLDNPLVWEAQEVQSMARLAKAALATADASAPDRHIRKLVAAITFTTAHADTSPTRRELLLQNRWKKDELDELATECDTWIFSARSGHSQSPVQR